MAQRREKTLLRNLTMKLFIWNITIAVLFVWSIDAIESVGLIGKCRSKCRSFSDGIAGSNEIYCDKTCALGECRTGCQNWRAAIGSNCSSVCNNTDVYTLSSCKQGCDVAVDLYLQQYNGTIQRPLLVDAGIGETSVILKWDFNLETEFRSLLRVQFSNEYTNFQDWEFSENVNSFSNQSHQISNLSPYLQYKFRMAVIITTNRWFLSAESRPIRTLPAGAPSNPPQIISATGTLTTIRLEWRRPRNINNYLLAYTVQVKNAENEVVINDVQDGSEFIRYSVKFLKPETLYHVNIAAVTDTGTGPYATRTVTTMKKQEDSTAPFLILGANRKIIKQDIDNIKEKYETLYEASEGTYIKGVAIHYERSLVFFSTSAGVVSRFSLRQQQKIKTIYESRVGLPQALSVDWLNNRLFISEAEQIISCNLNGKPCLPIVPNLRSRSHTIVADPLSGYLYYSLLGKENGIFRIALGKKRLKNDEAFEQRIVSGEDVRAFALNSIEHRLYYPDNNTIMACDLDGKNQQNFRPSSVQKRDYKNIDSLVEHDGLFYWSTGLHLQSEHRDEDKIYHNQMLVFTQNNTGLNVFHPTSQLIPVPLQYPEGLQAVFTSSTARFSWKPPDVTTENYNWMKWKYELYKNSSEGNRTLIVSTGDGISDLLPSNEYSFRIRAYFMKGLEGPWSPFFTGQTLSNDAWKIVLGFNDHLKITNGSRDLQTVPHTIGNLRDISEIGDDRYLICSERGLLYLLDRSGHRTQVSSVQSVSAIAFEHLTGMLYWAETFNRIWRTRLTNDETAGEKHLLLLVQDTVEDLVVDAVNGWIYWISKKSVEGSRLDGSDPHIIEQFPYFSGKDVTGLTLDRLRSKIYWIVKNTKNDTTEVWQRNINLLDGKKPSSNELLKEVFHLPGAIGLSLLDQQLMWLSTQGLYGLPLNPKYNGAFWRSFTTPDVTAVEVVTSNHSLTVNGVELRASDVVPHLIDSSKVHLFDNLTLIWSATPVNYGETFYQVMLRTESEILELHKTNKTELVLTSFKSFNKDSHIQLRSCSFWSCSSYIKVPYSISPTPAGLQESKDSILLITIFSVIFLIIAAASLTVFVVFLVLRRPKVKKPLGGDFIRPVQSDVELASLRALPNHGTLCTNALYNINNIVLSDEDVAALPHFGREQIILTQFLGSGAFGEVFEGIAKNIQSERPGDVKVAVKTLRKGASDYEKEEFLKEALLMANFNNRHIISLLGVCLDNDPQFLILELMQAGDLLSFLRNSRPHSGVSNQLRLEDIVDICSDVAKGCKYLEEMHFVHRDLAARNCLVSNRDPNHRIVKIGDFGLARDIYKNDYYRKEGEGLLPVRWMSPESLIDGVFTTQSDVWAFGVLTWEVFTLGQQPYPARTNVDVLHFVRAAGRLDRPDNCPDDMYALMLKCWAYEPEERPSFHYILGQLLNFLQRIQEGDQGFYSYRIPSRNSSYRKNSGRYLMTQPHVWQQQTQAGAGDRHISTSPDNPPGTRPPRHQSDDSGGYLSPIRYLELLNDDEDTTER